PDMIEAFLEERVAMCRIFETASATDFGKLLTANGPGANLWDKIKEPTFLFLTFAPRGWVYQNMATVAWLEEEMLAGFDPVRQIVVPHQIDRSGGIIGSTFRHRSPGNFLAAIAVPNFTRAWQSFAQNQTKANEAFIVCAL